MAKLILKIILGVIGLGTLLIKVYADKLAKHDLGGKWTLVNTVHHSSVARFRGLQWEYEMEVVQKGDEIYGTGQKWREKGVRLDKPVFTLTFRGKIEGDWVRATFVEIGGPRETHGEFTWEILEKGVLVGSFTHDAALQSGASRMEGRDEEGEDAAGQRAETLPRIYRPANITSLGAEGPERALSKIAGAKE